MIIDIATLPIRIFTALPRIFSNPKKSSNPLFVHLNSHLNKLNVKENLEEILKADKVKLDLDWPFPKFEGIKTLPEKKLPKGGTDTYEFNFIELPEYC